jgi:hypothetical protein
MKRPGFLPVGFGSPALDCPTASLLLRVTLIVAVTSSLLASAADTGPPSTTALDTARDQIARGLADKDPAAVQRGVAEAIQALGAAAGVPETPTRYFPPADTTPVELGPLRGAWLREVEQGLGGLPWRKNPNGDPERMQAGLREAAVPLDALARTALLFPEHGAELADHVRAGADWLVARQHPTGVFPFPVGPGLNPRDKVGHIVARAIREHPEIVADGWIPEVPGDGGLQFDNGLCGTALLSAWWLTGDARYLDASCRAGDWAIGRPMVSNWNYNAFSAGLLARLYTATGESRYLEAAVTKASVGVLPGQLPGGRWFDPHNASAVYHNILLRELLEVYHALPDGHALAPDLRQALTRGLDQAAGETLAKGFSGTWTECFARGLSWIGEEKAWRDALNTNLNAGGRGDAPSAGVALLAVLEGAGRGIDQ